MLRSPVIKIDADRVARYARNFEKLFEELLSDVLRSRPIDDKSNTIHAAGVDSDAQMFKSGRFKSCLQFGKPEVGR